MPTSRPAAETTTLVVVRGHDQHPALGINVAVVATGRRCVVDLLYSFSGHQGSAPVSSETGCNRLIVRQVAPASCMAGLKVVGGRVEIFPVEVVSGLPLEK